MGPYYEPESYGLTIVAQIDTSESYSFDMVVVWRDHYGRLWGAHDSGCSCPTPFESVKYPSDMSPIRAVGDLAPLLNQISEYSGPRAGDVLDFAAKVKAALDGQE